MQVASDEKNLEGTLPPDILSLTPSTEGRVSRHFVLTTRLPSCRTVGRGVLAVDRDGTAQLFSGDADWDSKVMATLRRVRLESAGDEEIVLSGMQPTGVDRRGCEIFQYQEWSLRYSEPWRFRLALMLPRSKPAYLGAGVLRIDSAGNACVMHDGSGRGTGSLASLSRARLESVSAAGFSVSGMELLEGGDPARRRFRLQEWWLRYPDRGDAASPSAVALP